FMTIDDLNRPTSAGSRRQYRCNTDRLCGTRELRDCKRPLLYGFRGRRHAPGLLQVGEHRQFEPFLLSPVLEQDTSFLNGNKFAHIRNTVMEVQQFLLLT